MCRPLFIILAVATTIFQSIEQGSCQSNLNPIIALTPESLILQPSQVDDKVPMKLTVVCATAFAAQSKLYAMRLKRRVKGSPTMENLVTADTGQTDPFLTTQLPGIEIFGGLRYRRLGMTLTDVRCHDEGSYLCYTSMAGIGRTINTDTTVTFTVSVTPGLILMMAFGDSDMLNITCDAIVGTADDVNEITWHWEYRTTDDVWNPYDGNATDITAGPLRNGSFENPDETCYKSQTSRLLRPLTPQDSERDYRCYVNNTLVPGNYTKFARVFSLAKPQTTLPNDKNVVPFTVEPKPEQDDQLNRNRSEVMKSVFPSDETSSTTIIAYIAIGVGSVLVLIMAVAVWRCTSARNDHPQTLPAARRYSSHSGLRQQPPGPAPAPDPTSGVSYASEASNLSSRGVSHTETDDQISDVESSAG